MADKHYFSVLDGTAMPGEGEWSKTLELAKESAKRQANHFGLRVFVFGLVEIIEPDKAMSQANQMKKIGGGGKRRRRMRLLKGTQLTFLDKEDD
jgi:hypothetical protein